MRPLIAILFFALAAYFIWGSPTSEAEVLGPRAPVNVIPKGLINPQDLRPVFADPPTVRIGGVDQGCSGCHQLWDSPDKPRIELEQHSHIKLDHGANDRCYNCHHQGVRGDESGKDRSHLVLHDGSPVGFDDVVQVCAKCHGTLYRDWERGMHGRTMGSWETGSPDQVRLGCTRCHDPHAPAFEPFKPLPGPNTWRMGVIQPSEHAEEHADDSDPSQENPLERWKHLDKGEGHE